MNPIIEKFKAALFKSRLARFSEDGGRFIPFQGVAAFTKDVDGILVDVFATFIRPEQGARPISLIALGGYGRAELCPFSDIDLLILHDTSQAPVEVEAAIRFFWDIGLSMSCVVRTKDECAGILGEDLSTDIAFLENRLLSGDADLYKRLIKDCVEPYFSRKKKQFVDKLRRVLQEKLYSPENALYHVEPDVKNGICALRDCHRLLWAEHLRTGASSLQELHSRSGFSARVTEQFTADYEFLLGLRSNLHMVCGRRMDILEIALQPEVALRYGFAEGAGPLMEQYYKTVRSIRLFLLSYVEKWPSNSGLWTAIRKRVGALEVAPGVRMTEGIFFGAGKNLGQPINPTWILTIFRQALRLRATLSVEIRNAIRATADKLSVDDFKSQRVNKFFDEILSFEGKIGHVVQLMHETGVLSKIIPQFGDLLCKVEYDSYHEFTVDQHLLMTIVAADDLDSSPEGSIAKIYSKCASKNVLRLSLLLHDIGKALPGDHAVNGAIIAEPVCERLGLDAEDVRRVRTLVYHHLDMAEMSFSRAPDDRQLLEFARRIEDRMTLDMLYVLTALDIMCVGHGTWTAWKAYQLEHLYNDLLPLFGVSDGEPRAPAGKGDNADDGYERDVLPEDRERHEVWFKQLTPGGLDIHTDEFHGFERLTVCGWDRMGFLRDIIGCISSEGYNILSAHLFSMALGKVLDIFYVEPPRVPSLPSGKRIENMQKKWHIIQNGPDSADSLVAERIKNYPLKELRNARQSKPHVTTEEGSSDAVTVLKIKTADNFGVLHKIVQCLGKNGANVRSAHLSTRGALAYDVFYITDEAHKKLDPRKLHKICRDIMEALHGTHQA
jgi:[protein-PII] uridylyltransferase